jgi:hypothetical protein
MLAFLRYLNGSSPNSTGGAPASAMLSAVAVTGSSSAGRPIKCQVPCIQIRPERLPTVSVDRRSPGRAMPCGFAAPSV